MIVIGGSLGGHTALLRILGDLPPKLPLPIAVVLHRHRESDDLLLPLLQAKSVLPMSEVIDKEPLESGRVYLCPPDYHLLVDEGCLTLSTDDLVNFARPSIDVLFESAAEWFGPRTIGVVLSGAGSDGAIGARRVVEQGGRILIQDPKTAEGPWMPEAALAATSLAEVWPLDRIAGRLLELS